MEPLFQLQCTCARGTYLGNIAFIILKQLYGRAEGDMRSANMQNNNNNETNIPEWETEQSTCSSVIKWVFNNGSFKTDTSTLLENAH